MWFRITEQLVILFFLKGKRKKEKKRKKEGENLRTGHFRLTSVVGWVFEFVDNHDEYFRIFPESHRVVT
jgi:hypothetical protein